MSVVTSRDVDAPAGSGVHLPTHAVPRLRRALGICLAAAMLMSGVLLPGSAGLPKAAAAAPFSARGIPQQGQVLFGVATVADIGSVESRLGGAMGVRRSYFLASQVGAAVERARGDLAAGRLPWLSFKAPASWAAVAAGAGDAWAQDLAARLGALPGPVWVAIHHEPEDDGRAADWVGMQRRLSPFFRARPNIAYTVILMGWHQFFSGDPQYSLDRYWPGKEYVDVLGFDPYNWYDTTKSDGSKNYTWTELGDYYAKIKEWLAATGNSDVQWAVAETGYTDSAASAPQNAVAPDGTTVSSVGRGSQWLARAYDDMKAMGGIALSYFDVAAGVNNEPADWTWPLQAETKVATFAHVLARSDRLGSAVAAAVTAVPARVATTAGLRTTPRRSKLHVNVGPNLPKKGYWRFRVEKLAKDGTWRPGKVLRTKGHGEKRVVNRAAGTYRIVVLADRGYQGSTSRNVKLRR